ncbi:MAG: TIGR02391 family protein [Thermomicrobiales bacterium]
MNVEWAIGELDTFLQQTVMYWSGDAPMSREVTAASDDEIIGQAVVTERILSVCDPAWREFLKPSATYENKWRPLRTAALRGREVLAREAELRENLGDNAPELSASAFHPWIWSGASSLWQSGHFAQAVEVAIRKLNAETQNKVGRRDVSEEDLFKQAFSLEAAQPGKARLRRMPPDDSKTYKNLQRGAMAFAEGIFAGMRNPLAHEAEHDLTEQQALEYLAALSVLARWVDEATVETVEGTP